MERIKKLKMIVLLQSVFVFLLAGCMIQYNCPVRIIVLLVAVWIIFAGYILFKIILPLRFFGETLRKYIREDCDEERLYMAAKEDPHMEQVYLLVEKYANDRTRKNSAKIFDKQTELTALQSQINPHFLYNTLDSIRGQALIDDNKEIARMVEALAAFFRYSISRSGNLVRLREELANIENYMLIQRYRFNNRFSLEVIVDEGDEEAYNFLIPKLIIQPVVENAIFHGLEEKLEGGSVTIEAIVTEQNLILTISDNGKGMDEETLNKLNSRIRNNGSEMVEVGEKGQRNTGIALPNIHKRIQLLFGEEYGVNVYSTAGQGTDVEITIPAHYARDGESTDEERDAAYQ